MSTKTNKLKTKDLIVAGAFAALYVVVLFAVVTVMGFVPILYLIAPFVNSVILGCIYMMYVMKVPKTGAILILSVAVGLLTSTGGVWVSLIWCRMSVSWTWQWYFMSGWEKGTGESLRQWSPGRRQTGGESRRKGSGSWLLSMQRGRCRQCFGGSGPCWKKRWREKAERCPERARRDLPGRISCMS